MNNFSGKYKLNLKALDKKAIHIFKVFEIISLSICILASFFLYLYKEFYISKCILECSVLIFRAGLLMYIFSFICMVFFSKYINEK